MEAGRFMNGGRKVYGWRQEGLGMEVRRIRDEGRKD